MYEIRFSFGYVFFFFSCELLDEIIIYEHRKKKTQEFVAFDEMTQIRHILNLIEINIRVMCAHTYTVNIYYIFNRI